MKPSTWFTSGCLALVVLGLLAGVLAFVLPGSFQFGWGESPTGKFNLPAIKKNAEAAAQGAVPPPVPTQDPKEARSHRTFVARTLVFLPDENTEEPVQPLRPDMLTADGIQVGWKQKYDFDPADPNVPNLDADGDGFTNLEEFRAETDPRDRQSSPAKESKLRSQSGDPVSLQVSFTAKSGGVFTIRLQVDGKRSEVKSVPGKEFWILFEGGRLEVFDTAARADQAAAQAREAGGSGHAIPVKITAYEEKIEKVKDASAGGIEVEIDNSFLLLTRGDAVRQEEKMFLSTPQKPRPLIWEVGDIRLFTPVEGGKVIGPFRVGQGFEYEGKKFTVLGREGAKVELSGEDGKKFMVPPEPSLNSEKPLGK